MRLVEVGPLGQFAPSEGNKPFQNWKEKFPESIFKVRLSRPQLTRLISELHDDKNYSTLR